MVQSVQKPFFRRSQVPFPTTRAAADIYATYLKATMKLNINILEICTLGVYLSKVSPADVMILKNSLQVFYLPSFMSKAFLRSFSGMKMIILCLAISEMVMSENCLLIWRIL